jgi:hypothetical protein
VEELSPSNGEVSSGVARGLSGADVGAEVARQMLASLRGERSAAPLAEAARTARAVGLSVSEMERMSGYTRQTVYNALRDVDAATEDADRDAAGDGTLLPRQLLIVLCAAGGAMPLPELARRLRLPVDRVAPSVRALREQGLCALERADPGGADGLEGVSVAATAPGQRVLLELFDDLFLRRSDGFSVYLAVEPEEQRRIEIVAEEVLSAHEHSVIEQRVAPGRMAGPELALTVHAATSRLAVRIAGDVWDELRARAGLDAAQPRLVDVVAPARPPCGESAVLDAFVTAIAEGCPSSAADVMRERRRYGGGEDERTLAGRCLTSAARALRRSIGQRADPRPITDGEAAFGEFMPVSGLPLDAPRAPIRRAVKQALELAVERLGPYPGGELGSFRHPHGEPHTPRQVHPSLEDLVRMAELAGEAVGTAAALGVGVDASAEVRSVVLPGSGA